jgi:hypothetical protein
MKNYEVPYCEAFSTPHCHPFWAQIFASRFCSHTLSLCSPLNIKNHLPQPYYKLGSPMWWPELEKSPTVAHACRKRRLKWVRSAWGLAGQLSPWGLTGTKFLRASTTLTCPSGSISMVCHRNRTSWEVLDGEAQ